MAVLMFDPGHGGRDPGAVGPTGLCEKTVTLQWAYDIAEAFKPSGNKILLTRYADEHLGPDESSDINARIKKANDAKADLFISLHCNSFKNPSAHGVETYHYPGSRAGKQLAEKIQKNLVSMTGLADRGVKESSHYGVLRYTNMPAVLIELGFISNPSEESLLKNPDFVYRASRAVYSGVLEYLGINIPEENLNWFKDVPRGHSAIEKVVKAGILQGFADGYFRPHESVTREQFSIAIARLLDKIGR